MVTCTCGPPSHSGHPWSRAALGGYTLLGPMCCTYGPEYGVGPVPRACDDASQSAGHRHRASTSELRNALPRSARGPRGPSSWGSRQRRWTANAQREEHRAFVIASTHFWCRGGRQPSMMHPMWTTTCRGRFWSSPTTKRQATNLRLGPRRKRRDQLRRDRYRYAPRRRGAASTRSRTPPSWFIPAPSWHLMTMFPPNVGISELAEGNEGFAGRCRDRVPTEPGRAHPEGPSFEGSILEGSIFRRGHRQRRGRWG